jgi:hypothetical protein
MLHPYSPKQVGQCLEGRNVVFAGDSTVRQVFCALFSSSTFHFSLKRAHEDGKTDATVKHVDKTVDTVAEKHSDRTLTAGGITFSFFWDPFLNGTRTSQLLDGTLGSVTGSGTPTLAVIGSGIWYLRHPDSGGINTWDRRIDAVFASTQPSYPPIADEVILLPVENAIESRLSPERAATVHNDDIKKMNALLDEKLRTTPSFVGGLGAPGLAIPRVFNKLIDGLEDETLDGLHFSEGISKVQASILLNLRCNDVLPKKFPFDKTCCFQYPSPNWVQALLLLFLVGFAPLGLYFYSRSASFLLSSRSLLSSPSSATTDDTNPSVFRFFPEQKHLLSLSIFGFAVTFLFVADRTNLFLKENKQYDALTFAVLCILTLVAGVATMKPIEKDLGFLNREQTDEWKGWMQIAILIYHYVGASKISGIYNPIRVLVAAYLFMSGYGHLSFFLKKADFGFNRVANILIRLNLLTVVLAYLMDTDYLSYYFSPLVTICLSLLLSSPLCSRIDKSFSSQGSESSGSPSGSATSTTTSPPSSSPNSSSRPSSPLSTSRSPDLSTRPSKPSTTSSEPPGTPTSGGSVKRSTCGSFGLECSLRTRSSRSKSTDSPTIRGTLPSRSILSSVRRSPWRGTSSSS